MNSTEVTAPIRVTVRGFVPAQQLAYARSKVESVLPLAPGTIRGAHVVVAVHRDPAHERPSSVEVDVDVNGELVRAHAAAPELNMAADLVEQRLRRRLVQLRDRMRTRKRWIGVSTEHEWRHGELPRHPLPYYPRPATARQIVRRKTLAIEPVTVDEAAYDMELLDHDFYLFTDAQTGADAVIYRRPDGGYGVYGEVETPVLEASPVLKRHGTPPTLSEREARERLDVGGERFVFYRDPVSGRGRVLYRRYDGHYGLILAAGD
jgi:ribosome-associated translation inhibitor RaiA